MSKQKGARINSTRVQWHMDPIPLICAKIHEMGYVYKQFDF
jgi:hypothetical protein